jgi:predicted nucleic acid-binding protein
LESLALKADWGYQKLNALYTLLRTTLILDLDTDLAKTYATVDAYSQGTLKFNPLPAGMTARNMGKNDLWIAATALHYDMSLRMADHDFDHLLSLGLKLNV